MAESHASGSAPPFAGGGRSQPPVALVGAGAVGTALAQRLKACGHEIAAVISRSEASAHRLATTVQAAIGSASFEALPERATLLFLCVPDDQVRAVARRLAERPHPWGRCLVVHTAGSLPAAALQPLAREGATVLCFHPLQAFAQGATAEQFDGIYVGLQGNRSATEAGRRLAATLNVTPFVLPEEAQAQYHLAASMASNLFVTLLALSGAVLDEALGDSHNANETRGAERLRPLVEGTVRNLRGRAPSEALTGPAVRGDEATIATHLQALQQRHAALMPTYAVLTAETVNLAVRDGRLSGAKGDALLRRLNDALGEQGGA